MSLLSQTMLQAPLAELLYGGNSSGGVLLRRMVQNPTKMNSYIRRGVVKHSTPGFYGYIVELDDNTCITCSPMEIGAGVLHGLGSTGCCVIPPGSEVVVLQSGVGSASGVILSVCNNQNYILDDKFYYIESDEGVSALAINEKPYSGDIARKLPTLSVGMYKAGDTYPGDWSVFNEFGAGYFLGRTRLSLRGSNMSRIDLLPIDDVFRVAAGYFQFFEHSGKTISFADNGGYVSYEKLFSPYIWESGGCKTAEEFDEKIKPPDDPNTKQDPLENEDMARYREYMGSIAGGRQIFTSMPKDGVNIGLSHIAISDSGALVFRSVSDIIFSRTNRIDVPVRIKTPEDKDGVDVPEIEPKDEQAEDEDWWKHDFARRTASNIIAQQYKRFKKNDKDWRIDSEDAKDDYDENVGSKTKVGADVSQIVLGQDGSITLSTAKGAEIRLDGENITISCPGNLSFRAGKEISFISNNDIVAKAKNDVELFSRHNITVAAERRAAMFGNKSVFIEGGTDDETKEGTRFGEGDGSETPGLYLVSAGKDNITMIDGRQIFVHPKETLVVSAVDEEGNTPEDSRLLLGIGNVYSSSFNFVINVGEDEEAEAGLIMQNKECILFADSASVIGGETAALFSATTMAMQVKGGSDAYAQIADSFKVFREQMLYDDYDGLFNFQYFSYKQYYDVEIEESPWTRIKPPHDSWGEDLAVQETVPWPGNDKVVKLVHQDLSDKVKYDDALGDKEKQSEDKPEALDERFSEYRG